jgi:hypothetical protein
MSDTDSVDRARDPQFGYATLPTPWTIRMRTLLPWQLVRFVIINLKMLRVIRRGHAR